MSLINDALKQARQSQSKAESPAAGPAMRPVEPGRRPERQSLILPTLIAIALLVGAISLGKWVASGEGALKVRANSQLQMTQPLAPSPETKTAQVSTPAVKPAPVSASTASVSNDTSLTVTVPVSNTLTAVEESKPQPPVFKLQGIFYTPKDPSAVINGKAVFLGSHVGGATVVAIAQDSATLVTSSGQTNFLELSDRAH